MSSTLGEPFERCAAELDLGGRVVSGILSCTQDGSVEFETTTALQRWSELGDARAGGSRVLAHGDLGHLPFLTGERERDAVSLLDVHMTGGGYCIPEPRIQRTVWKATAALVGGWRLDEPGERVVSVIEIDSPDFDGLMSDSGLTVRFRPTAKGATPFAEIAARQLPRMHVVWQGVGAIERRHGIALDPTPGLPTLTEHFTWRIVLDAEISVDGARETIRALGDIVGLLTGHRPQLGAVRLGLRAQNEGPGEVVWCGLHDRLLPTPARPTTAGAPSGARSTIPVGRMRRADWGHVLERAPIVLPMIRRSLASRDDAAFLENRLTTQLSALVGLDAVLPGAGKTSLQERVRSVVARSTEALGDLARHVDVFAPALVQARTAIEHPDQGNSEPTLEELYLLWRTSHAVFVAAVLAWSLPERARPELLTDSELSRQCASLARQWHRRGSATG